MANHKGSEGIVKIGANVVAEVKNWSLSESADTLEDTTMGDTAKTFQSSLTSATGSIDVLWDETDTNGQEAMTIGASVSLVLYPEGDTTGDVTLTMTALITERGMSAAHDGLIEQTFSFTVTGTVARATAA